MTIPKPSKACLGPNSRGCPSNIRIHGQRKRCLECDAEEKRLARQRYRQEQKERQPATLRKCPGYDNNRCKDKAWLRGSGNRKRCPECQKLARRRAKNESWSRNWPKYRLKRVKDSTPARPVVAKAHPARERLKALAEQAGLVSKAA